MQSYVHDYEVCQNAIMATFVDINVDIDKVNEYLKCNPDKTIRECCRELHVPAYQFVISQNRNDVRALQYLLQSKIYLIGVNNYGFDNYITNYILTLSNNEYDNVGKIIGDICTITIKLIRDKLQDIWWTDKMLQKLHYIDRNYISIDVMKFSLETVERKGLKAIMIILKWARIVDNPFKFEDYINDDGIELSLDYNLNDCLGTLFWYKHVKELLDIRYNIITQYKIDTLKEAEEILNANKSRLGEIIGAKLYSNATGLAYDEYKDVHTSRTFVNLKDCIFDKIKFKSEYLSQFLANLKERVVYGRDIDDIIKIGSGEYQFKLGGLHSIDKPARFDTTDEMIIKDVDEDGFYPNLISEYGIEPEHLIPGIYPKLTTNIIAERIKNKRISKDEAIEELIRLHAKYSQETFKIVLNAWVFGKMMFEGSWTKDIKAGYTVTMNGQLFLLMFIEELERAGFQTISANTDGLTILVPRNRYQTFLEIVEWFQDLTQISAELNEYRTYARRDVNNYIAIYSTGKVKKKGIFISEPDIKKSYGLPIRGKALEEFYLNGINPIDYVNSNKDILDYCLTKKIGQQYLNPIILQKGKRIELQRTLRYYVSTSGGILFKQKSNRLENILKNQYVTLFNDYILKENFSDYGLYIPFYLNEINNVINEINGNNKIVNHRFKKRTKATKKTIAKKAINDAQQLKLF